MAWSNKIPGLVNELVKHEKDFSVDKEYFHRSLLLFELKAEPSTLYMPINYAIEQESGNKRLAIDGVLFTSRMNQFKQGLVPFMIQDKGVIPKPIKDDIYDMTVFYYNKFFNKKQQEEMPSKWNESVLENMIKDSTVMSILIDKPVVPYALLMRLDIEEDKGVQKVIYTKPVLVKPGVSDFDRQAIYRWQEKNKMQTTLPNNI